MVRLSLNIFNKESNPPVNEETNSSKEAVKELVTDCKNTEPPSPAPKVGRKERLALIENIEQALRNDFPHAFNDMRKPLKVGIHKDLIPWCEKRKSPRNNYINSCNIGALIINICANLGEKPIAEI